MIKAFDGKARADRNRFLVMLALIGAAAGLAVALVSIRMESSLLTLALAVAGVLLAMVSLQASLRWWKAADEAVKEAHKSGWYWGGGAGLSVAGGLVALLFSLDADVSLRQFAVFPGGAGLMATGLLIAILLAFAGYTVAWAAWWLRNR